MYSDSSCLYGRSGVVVVLSVSLLVSLLVMTMSPGKVTEAIKMPFGMVDLAVLAAPTGRGYTVSH